MPSNFFEKPSFFFQSKLFSVQDAEKKRGKILKKMWAGKENMTIN